MKMSGGAWLLICGFVYVAVTYPLVFFFHWGAANDDFRIIYIQMLWLVISSMPVWVKPIAQLCHTRLLWETDKLAPEVFEEEQSAVYIDYILTLADGSQQEINRVYETDSGTDWVIFKTESVDYGFRPKELTRFESVASTEALPGQSQPVQQQQGATVETPDEVIRHNFSC
jgi:hypothetical protein